MSKHKLIPELRFPEFSESWDITSVSDLCNVYKGGSFSKADMDDNGSEPCIHYGELFTKYNEVISVIYSKTNKSDGFKSKVGDILMPSSDVTPTGLAKASAITLDNVVLGGDMNIIRPKTSINSIFLSYLLNHSKREIIKLVSGTTVKHIYPSQIITCQLYIVKNGIEQQKIASCLSSLDEVIAAHSQKLALLKEHRKGLMQNLFPQAGEKVPKYRFKEFEGDGEWVEKKLGEIGKVTSGGTPNRSDNEFWNGDIPWVSTTLINFNIIYEVKEYITEIGLQNSSAKIFPKNTILMAMYGQGKTRGKVAILGIDAATNQACAAIMLNDKYNTEFVFQYLSANYDEIRRMSNSGGQENLSGGLIEIIPIPLPKTHKEQQKIASCLSSLDALITAQAEQIAQLKLHKKGLMQGLFPKIKD
jgi:type I restriction enzyme S subunit